MSASRPTARWAPCLALLLPLLGACGGDEAKPAADGAGSSPGTEDDAGTDGDGGTDGGSDGDTAAPLGPTITFAPSWQWVGPGTARLRMDTIEDVDMTVVLDMDGAESSQVMDRTAHTLSYAWPVEALLDQSDHPDLAGTHHLHELVVEGLAPGTVLGWRIDTGIEELAGTLHAPPAPGGAFTVVFFGDTMSPFSDGVFQAAADAAPELMLHGGDLQYIPNPLDTWAGLSWALAPVSSQAAFHPAVGNHEHEDMDEFTEMYTRLFDGLGTAPAPEGASYYRLDHGGVRFLAIDTEGAGDHHLSAPDSLQLAWLEAELVDAAADPDIHAVVPWYHRPIYTLAEHAPDLGLRERLHPLFRDHGVQLVLQAHNHSYERMVADGVTYITDGGGGALLYDVSAQAEAFADELPLRQAASQSFGYTRLDFDGTTVSLVRTTAEGERVDATTLTLEPLR